MDNKKKTIMISTIIILLLIAIVGVTYAFFTYENGAESEIVTGQIYMNYEETKTISLAGVFPETKAQALARTDENGVFEFTITGRNTSRYPVYYEIDLLDGGVITGKTETSTKILPEHVMIYLEKDGVPVVDGVTYADWNNRRIYVDTVPANQATNIEHKYVLRMWIDENVTISDTDSNADYTTEEWNDSYTSLQVRVVGDFEEKEIVTETDASCFTYNILNESEIEITNYDVGCGTDVVIPAYIEELPVTTIGARAFNGYWLTDVTIPDSVITIGASAFGFNNLTELVIPDSVTTIDEWAFRGNGLTIITLGKNVSSIGDSAFELSNKYGEWNPIEKVINKSGNAFDWKNIFDSSNDGEIVQNPGVVATGTYIYYYNGNREILITSE